MTDDGTPRRTSQQQTGDDGENQAEVFLRGCGYRILGRNVRVGRDELDIVAEDGDVVVFVEVRVRVLTRDALESVTLKKQRRVIRAAARYLGPMVHRRFSRFDVVVITDDGVTHLPDAFRPV